MVLTTSHIIGIAATLLIVIAVGIYAGRKVKTADDFATGGRSAGASLIAGTIIGTLVSGASTVGTAQLAFQYGFSAWWFTLGAGMAFLIMGLTMVSKIYNSNVSTIPQYLTGTYGSAIGPVSSTFTIIGISMSMLAQTLSLVALLTAIFPINSFMAASAGALLVFAYVLSGGVWGTGMIGVVKLVLLYFAMITCGGAAYFMSGGFEKLSQALPVFPFFSLFGRGAATDVAAGFSLIVGILSTQIYFQAIMSGKTLKEAYRGTFMSALLIPPLGLGGIMVGLFMRANFPETASGEVLPLFIINFLPPILAGIVLATLLITIVGGWAGLALGISTLITNDLYGRFRPNLSSDQKLYAQRIFIVLICILSVFIASGNVGSMILLWSFMSMGFRGCTVLFPLLGAMFWPRFVTPAGGLAAAVSGPAVNVLWKVSFPHGIDPLYPGLMASFLALLLVSKLTSKHDAQIQKNL